MEKPLFKLTALAALTLGLAACGGEKQGGAAGGSGAAAGGSSTLVY